MLGCTPFGLLVKEAVFIPVEVLQDGRGLKCATRLLGYPDGHPAKDNLLVSFREEDQHVQPGDQTRKSEVGRAP
ncbi:hypothetical protein BDV10DRAFT_175278 [Aspergillus recurvatus]